ncbi:hypothetical protein FNV43_RR00449 [Rhamnella rubrinervis]|uniref:Uncharacterized protein n=1 Tax=Rhamnella rubrinervis TaxID=2594499 RepID=A0A8K0HMW2_9ROSA|nr:hypothetical protein FNV43_RR00449 [Rhamnella rubrinervis]
MDRVSRPDCCGFMLSGGVKWSVNWFCRVQAIITSSSTLWIRELEIVVQCSEKLDQPDFHGFRELWLLDLHRRVGLVVRIAFKESLAQGYQLSLDDNVVGGIAQVSDSGKAVAVPMMFRTSILLQLFSMVIHLHHQILFDLARSIEVPLRIDNATLSSNFGHFARVLIDVDLAGHLVGRYHMVHRRAPSVAKPSDKSKDESKPITQIYRPKPPNTTHQFDSTQGQSSGLQVENSPEDQQTVAVTIGIDILGTKVTTSAVVDFEILAMDLDAVVLVYKIIRGKSVQNVSSDLNDTFDDLDDELSLVEGGAI